MNNTIDKMQWFIDKYNNNELSYAIAKTSKNFGTCVMPTGYGKSGYVYEDIIHTINNNKKGHKVIINISCPILKLTQQFINDFFSIATSIYSNSVNFSFFINSSDTGKMYNDAVSSMNIDIDKFKDIKTKFINNPNIDIAIVASCHKSLGKFINTISHIKENVEIISYIDESHLIDIHKNNEDDAVVYVDINKLCKYSTKVYSFSATPDLEVVNTINKFNTQNDSKYLLHVRPIEAIHDNIILPPHVNYIKTNKENIVSDMLVSIMKDTIYNNPDIKHKVLVTLKSSKQLIQIREQLEKQGYKVFSTCSEYGYGITTESEDEKIDNYKDVTDFINAVDTYDGNCFVLHIKQLIQGIDIKSLTDCVIYSANNGSTKHYRHIIQIIGRVLRPLIGERGIDKNNRKKKTGTVYFISPSDNDEVENNISEFICRYYGFDNIDFEFKSYKSAGLDNDDLYDSLQRNKYNSGWDNPTISELLINIENYINEKVIKVIKLNKKLGRKYNVQDVCKKILDNCDIFGKSMSTDDLLDNKELFDKTFNIFDKIEKETGCKLF